MGTAGKYGINPNDLALICDGATFLKMCQLSEVLTLDKMGPMATVLTGQLASLSGFPVIPSEDYGLTVAAGHVHYSTNTLGQFIIVNRKGIKIGWRRRPRIIVDRAGPFAEASGIMATCRFDIGFFGTGMVGMGFNVTV